jgi:hypothetical protein
VWEEYIPPPDSAECERHDDQLIQVADDGQEIRYRIDWAGNIDRQPDQHPPHPAWNALIPGKRAEPPRKAHEIHADRFQLGGAFRGGEPGAPDPEEEKRAKNHKKGGYDEDAPQPGRHVLLMTADDALENLAGFRHDEAQAVQVIQHLEQLISLERGDGIGQLSAFAKCRDQILARLGTSALC